MNKAKWMQGVGACLAVGSVGYFLWSMVSIWNRFAVVAGQSQTGGQIISSWVNSASESVVMYLPLLVLVMVGGAIFKKGKDLEDAELKTQQRPVDEDHGWRKNPFQKGETSDRMIPRDYFLKKRNRWRKVIDAPNKDGY